MAQTALADEPPEYDHETDMPESMKRVEAALDSFAESVWKRMTEKELLIEILRVLRRIDDRLDGRR